MLETANTVLLTIILAIYALMSFTVVNIVYGSYNVSPSACKVADNGDIEDPGACDDGGGGVIPEPPRCQVHICPQ